MNRLRTKGMPLLLLTFAFCGAAQPPLLAQTSTPPTQTTAAAADSSYVLGAGDQVAITVFGYDEYTGVHVILPDGTIKLSLLAPVQASGKTTEQLAHDLTNRLQSLLVNPVVTIGLTTLRPVTVNVAGEVQHPGPVQLRSLTTVAGANVSSSSANVPEQNALTVGNALTAAGGITQNADIRQVVLKRSGPDGRSSETTIDLWNAIASSDSAPSLVLRDGDSLYIPRLAAGSTIDRHLVARSRYAPNTVRVRVVGEVKKPGEIEVPPDSSISSAVAIAGGPTEDARLGKVAFVRLEEDGHLSRRTIDLRNLTDNYQIQEGDVVIVPKKTTSSILDYASRLLGPLGVVLGRF